MSLQVFCPHRECAARVTYDTIKPTVCPQCRKTFASAFAVTPPPAPVVTRAAVQDEDEDSRPLGRAATAAHKSTTVIKSRPGKPEPSRLMNTPASVSEPVFPDDGVDDEDEDLDPREVRRKARELAATIDVSTIHIADQDEKTVKFAQIWTEEAGRREAAAQAQPVKSKRKARR